MKKKIGLIPLKLDHLPIDLIVHLLPSLALGQGTETIKNLFCIMMLPSFEKILILAKTYPSPSKKYAETSCIAGVNDQGLMRRLFPVPFRLLAENKQFRKWQWISARTQKSSTDHRKESYKLFIDDMTLGTQISTKNHWSSRLEWLNKIPKYEDFDLLSADCATSKLSLALLKPKHISLEIRPARRQNWTKEERAKLMQAQMQESLFSTEQVREQIKCLTYIPFGFYYHYTCDTANGERTYCHKIVDWEAMALFWNCKRRHGDNWTTPFRQKLEQEFSDKDLMFLMGNQHRFQDQWLIVSLIYPPKLPPFLPEKVSLLF